MVASKALTPHPNAALYRALLALPDDLVSEIVNGRLVATPRPGLPHVAATSGLGAVLMTLFQFGGGGGPGGWIILDEPELHLGEDVLVPDLAGWRKTRLPVVPPDPFMTLAPDWVCEGISSSTEVFDRSEKAPAYASHGVGHLWLMDPASRVLEVFRNERGSFRLRATHRGNTACRVEPFDAVKLDLSMFWLAGSPGPKRPKRR